MRYLFLFLISVFIISDLSYAEPNSAEVSRSTTLLTTIFDQTFQTTSLQFSLFSYKPELGDLNNTLQNFGINDNPVAMMPTFSLVYQHIPELDSRLEIGYWHTQIETPQPASFSLAATLMPVSYQLIYRPILLYDYLPIYLGAGIGFFRTNFDGDVVDLLAEQGITLNDVVSTTTGFAILGFELYHWKSQTATQAALGNNVMLNLEFKRILKTVETTGTQPLNIVLDGTAIGFGVRTQF